MTADDAGTPLEELRFDGRVVVVTGASRGIGRELAEVYAGRGARLVLNGRGKEALDGAVRELAGRGVEVLGVVGDLADPGTARELTDRTIERFGRLDVLVNNAGALSLSPFAELSPEVFESVVGVNLNGTFRLTQAAWPHLVASGSGRVIVTASHGVFGAADSAHYVLSKAALVGLMRALSIEGRPHGITVNAVLPFAITDMMAGAMAGGADAVEGGDADLAAAAEYLQPRYVAPLTAWLTHASCAVTGEMFTVGGGRVARVFLGETNGYHDLQLSPESLRDHWQEVCDENGYTVPADLVASLSKVIDALKSLAST